MHVASCPDYFYRIIKKLESKDKISRTEMEQKLKPPTLFYFTEGAEPLQKFILQSSYIL